MWPEDQSECDCGHRASAHLRNGNGYCTQCKTCYVFRFKNTPKGEALEERRAMFELGRICNEIQTSDN
jgi:hypothetical protein